MPSTAFWIAPFSISARSQVLRASPRPSLWRFLWPSSGMGWEGRQLLLRHRLVAQSKFHRHIVEPARREATIEMPHPGHDHPDHGNLDIRTGLVERHEVISRAPRDL